MKKSIYILASLLMASLSNPIFAQADPGVDPDATGVPIDDHIWVLILIAITIAILKFRAIYKQSISTKV